MTMLYRVGDLCRLSNTLVVVVGVASKISNEGWCYGVTFIHPLLEWQSDGSLHCYRVPGETVNAFESKLTKVEYVINYH